MRENTKKMEIRGSRWIAAVASIWIQCSCGASYAFAIYSPLLKSTQNYDQSTLDTVSVFKDIGANAGIISGLLYSAVSVRSGRLAYLRGPWVVHFAGVIQCFAGYFFIWLSVAGIIHRPPVPAMCFFMFLAAHAQTFFNTANVVTAVHNFPDYSGTIVGIMKGFLGLSGSVLVQIYRTFLHDDPSTFLLMIALLPTIVSLLFMCSIQIYPTKTGDDKKHLNGFSLISVILAAYLLVVIVSNNVVTTPSWVSILTFSGLMLLLASPLWIAIRAQTEDSERPSKVFTDERSRLIQDSVLETDSTSTSKGTRDHHHIVSTSQAVGETAISDGDELQLTKEKNLLQAMSTLDFWLLFIAMLCGMGSGLATVNNISQIGESLDYTRVEINTLVSLWSIWNFLGRFGGGYISDMFLHSRGWARPLFVAITLTTMTVGHIVIASGFPGNLYVGSVLVGISYGSQWSLMPTITSEIFGVRHMGTIFNTIAIASPVGSSILSVGVIGSIYDKEALVGEGNSCHGIHCFMLSFFILACVSLSGSLVASILFLRTRRFYSQILVRRLRQL